MQGLYFGQAVFLEWVGIVGLICLAILLLIHKRSIPESKIDQYLDEKISLGENVDKWVLIKKSINEGRFKA